MRVYFIQMTIRTVCFLLAIFTRGWWQLAFLGLAFILPYLAVIDANTEKRDRRPISEFQNKPVIGAHTEEDTAETKPFPEHENPSVVIEADPELKPRVDSRGVLEGSGASGDSTVQGPPEQRQCDG